MPDGTKLPKSIYDAARPLFLSDWEAWCQKLSVPTSLAADYPHALKGENVKSSTAERMFLFLLPHLTNTGTTITQCEKFYATFSIYLLPVLRLQDEKRADYFLDDVLLDENWKQ